MPSYTLNFITEAAVLHDAPSGLPCVVERPGGRFDALLKAGLAREITRDLPTSEKGLAEWRPSVPFAFATGDPDAGTVQLVARDEDGCTLLGDGEAPAGSASPASFDDATNTWKLTVPDDAPRPPPRPPVTFPVTTLSAARADESVLACVDGDRWLLAFVSIQ